MRILVSGENEPAGALAGALLEADGEVVLVAIHDTPGQRPVPALAAAMVELETRIAEIEPGVAVAVGVGDATIALALVATKLGVPLLSCRREPSAADDARDADARLELAEARILDELAEASFELPGDRVGADVVAERVLAWASSASEPNS